MDAGRGRRIAFVVALSLLLLVTALLSPLPFAVLGWTLSGEGTSHRVHEVTFGTLFLVSAIGTLRLFRHRTPGALYQSVLPLWTMLVLVVSVDQVVDPFIAMFLVLPAVVVALYPGRRFQSPRPHRALVVLAVVATVPLLLYSGDQIATAVEATDVAQGVSIEGESEEEFEAQVDAVARDEAEKALLIHTGHWSAMGGFGLVAVVFAWVVALRPDGWEGLAVVIGAAVAHFGAVSLSAPSDASAADQTWAIAAILWGVATIATTLVIRSRSPRRVGEAVPEAA